MADTVVERVTGQATAGDVHAEVAIVVPVDALTQPETTGNAAEVVVGHGPIPAALAKEILAGSAERRVVAAVVHRPTRWGRRRRQQPDAARRHPGRLVAYPDGGRAGAVLRCSRRQLDHIALPRRRPDDLGNGRAACVRSDQVREMPGWAVRLVHDGLGARRTPSSRSPPPATPTPAVPAPNPDLREGSTGRAGPAPAARPRRTSTPPRGAGSRRGRTRRCPRSAYSAIRSATSSWLPTRAVPAPPRTRPTPAQRFGRDLEVVAVEPPCRSSIRRWPSDSLRRQARLHARRSSAGSMPASSRSASAQASSAVSRVITCRRMPKRSSRPCSAASRGSSSSFSAHRVRRLAPGQVDVGVPGRDRPGGRARSRRSRSAAPGRARAGSRRLLDAEVRRPSKSTVSPAPQRRGRPRGTRRCGRSASSLSRKSP